MVRALLLLTALVGGMLAVVASGAQAAARSQTLGIVLHRNHAATHGLATYRSSAPIIVNVAGDAANLTAVTITAHGPDGAAITAPLARIGNEFTGDLRLATPGQWTLALSAQLGSFSAALANVPLNVVPEDGSDAVAHLAFALAGLSIATGIALIAGRRYET